MIISSRTSVCFFLKIKFDLHENNHSVHSLAKLLLSNGLNPNLKDSNGNSALHLAVLSNHIEMVTLLLKSGASVKEEDNNGRTPLHLAKSRLKIIQDCTSYNSEQLKQEAKNIIEMMQIYLTKCCRTEKLIVLNHFITRLNIHETKEDVSIERGKSESICAFFC